jgi:hypothetical protein
MKCKFSEVLTCPFRKWKKTKKVCIECMLSFAISLPQKGGDQDAGDRTERVGSGNPKIVPGSESTD